jgi:pimeloyl-ACP methyl ester carboxylesterase
MPRRKTEPGSPPVNVRRMYVDCRFGQMHLRTAFSGNGGFDELTPLVCLHQSPMSGRVFEPFLSLMGTDRTAYAPDTPGFGESDPPTGPPTIEDYAGAVGDFLDHLRLRRVDLLGYHTGACIAAELAIARPEQVRRVVMVAAPVFTEVEREAFDRARWPVPLREDGAHLVEEWQRSLRWRGPGITLEQVAASFADKLRNGPRAWWGAHAAMHWAGADRLPRVSQPVLVLRPRDDLWDVTPRARPLLPRATFTDLPEQGFGLFDASAAVVAGHVRRFLDQDAPG